MLRYVPEAALYGHLGSFGGPERGVRGDGAVVSRTASRDVWRGDGRAGHIGIAMRSHADDGAQCCVGLVKVVAVIVDPRVIPCNILNARTGKDTEAVTYGLEGIGLAVKEDGRWSGRQAGHVAVGGTGNYSTAEDIRRRDTICQGDRFASIYSICGVSTYTSKTRKGRAWIQGRCRRRTPVHPPSPSIASGSSRAPSGTRAPCQRPTKCSSASCGRDICGDHH